MAVTSIGSSSAGGLFLSANRIPGRVYKVKLPRVKTAINVRCATSDIVVLEDTFLRGHYEFSLEDEPEVIVDAGAHIGLVTVLFANLFWFRRNYRSCPYNRLTVYVTDLNGKYAYKRCSKSPDYGRP